MCWLGSWPLSSRLLSSRRMITRCSPILVVRPNRERLWPGRIADFRALARAAEWIDDRARAANAAGDAPIRDVRMTHRPDEFSLAAGLKHRSECRIAEVVFVGR